MSKNQNITQLRVRYFISLQNIYFTPIHFCILHKQFWCISRASPQQCLARKNDYNNVNRENADCQKLFKRVFVFIVFVFSIVKKNGEKKLHCDSHFTYRKKIKNMLTRGYNHVMIFTDMFTVNNMYTTHEYRAVPHVILLWGSKQDTSVTHPVKQVKTVYV